MTDIEQCARDVVKRLRNLPFADSIHNIRLHIEAADLIEALLAERAHFTKENTDG